MKAAYTLFSLGLVSAANIIGREPEKPDNIFDEIINNNNKDNNKDLNNFLQGFKGVNLNDLEIDGLNFGNIDLNSQDALVQGILSLLAGFCVNNNVLNQNNLLNIGLNNELELFFELAQLAQLQQLGFLNGNGLRGLFNSGALLGGGGGFNIGHFKREVAEMKKTMKRTKLRRGSISKNQCDQFDISSTTTAAFESVVATSTVESSSVASAAETAAPAAEETAGEVFASSTAAEASASAVATSSALPPQNTSDIVLDNPEG
ncbi:hypothetical protein QBC37DRAFT_390491 [Rhypophila decipiens]|uniref:Uncharacterized protein n=1 Tax=Rhypophila decipiens TaxID=261697 RepID=A0AAN6Y5D3_9PEZI|nr:hypothetical protein QBC37DRAFT_390491 [Rhypophila decipiens]